MHKQEPSLKKSYHFKCFCAHTLTALLPQDYGGNTHILTHANYALGKMFVGVEQQINGGIDKWLWFPNEALHDAVLGLFLSGSQQLPSLAGKSQHSM